VRGPSAQNDADSQTLCDTPASAIAARHRGRICPFERRTQIVDLELRGGDERAIGAPTPFVLFERF
jgi:hypothetical protein